MARDTGRDKAWNYILSSALDGEEIRTTAVAAATGVSERTAADCLKTMVEYGWIEKNDGRGPRRAYWTAGERLPKNLTSYTEEQ